MRTDRIYAVRDVKTGKLVSDLTNPRRKYWDRLASAEAAIRKNIKYNPNLKLVVFQIVELSDQEKR